MPAAALGGDGGGVTIPQRDRAHEDERRRRGRIGGPEPVAVWHFLSDDWEHEHWAQSSKEADELIAAYAERGEPYTVRQLLVEPDECPPPEDDSDAYCDL